MRQIKITPSLTTRTMAVESYLRDISKIPMITVEEETELASRIQRGDKAARERLVRANLRFVVSVAKQYQNYGYELPDLIAEGNIGLIKAAEKFDPTRGFKFISYAVWWIRQQIISAISDNGRTIRLPANQASLLSKAAKARQDFIQKNEREPSPEELAEALNMEVDKVMQLYSNNTQIQSMDKPFSDDNENTFLDVTADTSLPETDSGLQRESLSIELMDIMKGLAPREQEILKLSFGLGERQMTLEEIGWKMSISRERVRQIQQLAIRRLRRPAEVAGLTQYM